MLKLCHNAKQIKKLIKKFNFRKFRMTVVGDCYPEIRRWLLFGRKAMTNLDSVLKSRDTTLLTKVHIVKAMVFPVVMHSCESWTVKKAEHQRIYALNCGAGKDSWKSLGQQGDQTSQSKGNQSWIFIGRADAEAETPIFWSSDVNSWLIGKVPDAGKDWGQKEKMASEDEMAGWHHWWNGNELGQTLGDFEGQGGLACCSPWGRKEFDMTEWLNNSNKYLI